MIKKFIFFALLTCFLLSSMFASGLINTTPSLWIKFSTPKYIDVVNVMSCNPDEMLAAITLQGAYNQLQTATRIYTIQGMEDSVFWLNNAIPKDISIKWLNNLSSSGGLETLSLLLKQFGHYIKGAITYDPKNIATINIATTMAGINDAMVISPSLKPYVESFGIKILADLSDYHWKTERSAYEWAVQNLLPKTNNKMLIMLDPAIYGYLRDYAVATKSFVFWFSASQYPSLFSKILDHTPSNTPIMGYIPDEGPDVAALSKLGHFLNASDYLSNESVWASMPSPKNLTQAQPKAIKAEPGTVYLSFMVSDGDNSQYIEHQMMHNWQLNSQEINPFLEKIPEGWTMPPGMIDFAPTIMEYYYNHLPITNEIDAGPCGVGYATAMSGNNLIEFAKTSGEFMKRDDMPIVVYWGDEKVLDTYATSSNIDGIWWYNEYGYKLVGITGIFGQTNGYISSVDKMVETIESQVKTSDSNKPIFLASYVDGWHLSPLSVYAIALKLSYDGEKMGDKYVFVTPGVLFETMKSYFEGKEENLPSYNSQSVSGKQLLSEPDVNLILKHFPFF
ncbi:MAG: GxGYxYP family putative glycoside hydrolase [Candidatus Parvarchaeota archaeon]|nr:GxGYxYP family putative glycoside hydrolase [Candidatus Jingweiarchaeum tengchongense]